MSIRLNASRARHAFPRASAALLLCLRGGLHSTRWVRRNFDFSSAWTTAVIAGVLGLTLTFLLFAFGPPPDAAAGATTETGSEHAGTSESPAPVPNPSNLELELQRTHLPTGWNQQELSLVESMTPPANPVSQGFVLLPSDSWEVASLLPASSAAEPYYLRAPRVDVPRGALVLEAADVPPGEFGPPFERNLAVSVERVAVTDGANGDAGEYSLIVRNTGAESVESVVVRDSVPNIEQVLDVVPPAAIAPDGSLVWSLHDLRAGDEIRLTVTVQSTGDPIESTPSVEVASQFGVSTRIVRAVRPPAFSSTPDAPELVLPEPSTLDGNVAASAAIPFDDELPESPATLTFPSVLPDENHGNVAGRAAIPFDDELPDSPAVLPLPATLADGDRTDSDLVVPDSILPAAARPAGPVEAFEDELPAGNTAAADPDPAGPATPVSAPGAGEPAGSVPFDDVIPDPSVVEPAEDSPPPAASGRDPFDPFASNSSDQDPAESAAPPRNMLRDDDVLPAETPDPAPATPAERPDRSENPAWAPRTLPVDEWQAPPRPVLSIKAVSPESVRQGEIVTAWYDITNTGNAPAVDIVVTVHLPDELLHKHGSTVEHHIEQLGPGESRRARLLARARSSGTARLNATLSHANQRDDQSTVSIRIVGQRAASGR